MGMQCIDCRAKCGGTTLSNENGTMTKIAMISGSLRAESLNTALLHAAAAHAPEGLECTLVRFDDVPLYNSDITETPAVVAFKEAIGRADGVLIATPEYNYSIPGPLKNAIDWASKPTYAGPFLNKPVGIIGASMGAVGTARAQGHLKQVILAIGGQVFGYPEFLVGAAHTKIVDGALIDETTAQFLSKYLAAFEGYVARFKDA